MKKLPTLLIIFIFIGIVYSFAEERIILTTYYPAPYGVYKEMRADQMTVGSAYRNSPVSNGRLFVSGSVGIGTTNPYHPDIAVPLALAVAGDASMGASIFTGSGTSGTRLELGELSSGNRDAYIDFHAVGTVSPWSMPDYNLRIIRWAGTNGASTIAHTGTGNFTIGTEGAASVFFNTSGAMRASISSDGKVGIGTASPAQKLHVYDSGDVDTELRIEAKSPYDPRIYFKSSEGDIEGHKIWYDNSVGDTYFDNMYSTGTDTNPAIRFRTKTFGAAVSALTILHNGRVGIGLTDPSAMLEVKNMSGPALMLTTSVGATYDWLMFNADAGGYNYGSFRRLPTGINLNLGSSSYEFTVTGANVGIGTTNPASTLDVNGNLAVSGTVGIGAAPTTSKLYINQSGTTYAFRVESSGGTAIGATTTAASSTAVRGTASSPTSSIGVEGHGRYMGVYSCGDSTGSCNYPGSGVYDFYAGGNGTDYGTSSSIRWKKNIKPLKNALNKVLKLRGVYFDWDKAHGGKRDLGMIAEEVGKEFPEFVVYEADGKYTSGMDYSKLTTVLVEAIKEQQRQIKEQQKQIDELKKEFNKFKNSKVIKGGTL